MPFLKELVMEDVEKAYGEYQATFVSLTGQVRVDLFKSGEWLMAYITFPTGLDGASVTDPYVSQLWEYAREHGFGRRLKMFMY